MYVVFSAGLSCSCKFGQEIASVNKVRVSFPHYVNNAVENLFKRKIQLLTVLINIMLITFLFLLFAFVHPDDVSGDGQGSTKEAS